MRIKILLLCILGLGLIALQSRAFHEASASVSGPAPERQDSSSSAAPQGVGLTLTVNGQGDGHDIMPGDSICDAGQGCTLRAAIEEANANPGRETINFSINLPVPITLALTEPLPVITGGVLIDGTSQPGYAGTPVIELNGSNITGNGLDISSGTSEVRALAINRFNGNGIVLQNSGENIITGCFIGTDPAGNADLGNTGSGIEITNASGNAIGGPFFDLRNVISGNGGAGVLITGEGSTFNKVSGNFIGTTASGTSALGNAGAGVRISDAFSNDIGGGLGGEGNVISSNNIGVEIIGDSEGNLVQGNFIGTDVNGTANLGNATFGVRIAASSNQIGEPLEQPVRPASSRVHPLGLPPGTAANIIAFNGDDGVAVISGVSNVILGNSIFSNSVLGIDLGNDGVTPNDAGDSDSGPNELQNFPVLTSATTVSDELTITGSLNSQVGREYRLDFYANPSCDQSGFGEGRLFLGTRTVFTSTSGGASFTRMFGANVAPGSSITATATDELGNTSEFSQCVTVTGMGPQTDVAINKTASPSPVATGSDLTYTITVSNISGVTADEVTVSDQIPPGTTFVSLASPGNCVTPPAGGTGQVTCQLGSLGANSQVILTLTVNVTANPGSTITNTASVTTSTSDSDPNSNSSTAMTLVIPESDCTITCPPDQVVNVSANQCGAAVAYPAPQATDCGTVTCTPPANSTFPVGLTTVNCTTTAGPACSFNVTVVDNIQPTINCPGGIVLRPPQNQSSAIVSFPAPAVADNCPGTTVQCQPPSGTAFPLGVTTVICIATDASSNSRSCSFTVTIDNEAPAISCPQNITVQPPENQTGNDCSTTVSYPNPVVADNQAGVVVVCSPPSGSAFPSGVTTVNCTATDRSGNTSTCSFTVTNNAGPRLSGSVSLNITLGPGEPVRKPGKSRPANCSNCTEEFASLQNNGCAPATLMLRSIMRVGPDVNNGRITNTDDSAFFSVSVIGNNGQSSPLPAGSSLTIQPGQSRVLRITFRPVIPLYANRTDQLAASQVLPEVVRTRLLFSAAAPFLEFPVDVVARVRPEVKLLHPTNPRRAKTVSFERSGDELRITYGIYDANLNVDRARYEFFDSNGRAVGQAFDVNLSESIRASDLLAGQSFNITQRFAGALANPAISSVRVTVFDAESSDSATGTLGASAGASAASAEVLRLQGSLIILPDLWLKQ